jgi:hypothetical protein
MDWILWSAAALAASLAHVLIDYHVGLYGSASSTAMSFLQATNILLTSLVYACWIASLGLATSGYRSGLLATLVLTVGWAVVWNGLVGLIVCPPPCRNAFPYQDIAHMSSLIFGALAVYTTWQKIGDTTGPINAVLTICIIIVMLAAFVVQSVLGLARR